MKTTYLILLLFSFNFIYGQSRLTSYSAILPSPDSLNIALVDIQKSEYAFYFRLKLSGQTIDIYSPDKEEFHAEITNAIKEYEQLKIDDDYHTQATKLHTQKVEIDNSLSTEIGLQIISSKQHSIPTDTLISGWSNWFLHCGNLEFEIKHDGSYIKQSFYCPWNQADSVEFKDVILSNYNLLKEKLRLDSIYGEFFSQLPKGKTYSRNGYGMTYVLTEKEEKAWNKDKPRRDYLESIKDTVDNYFNIKLNSLQALSDSLEYSCYGAYHLTFGKNGKLKDIWTHAENELNIWDGLSWYIEDKIELRRCYKQVKRIFKKVHLSSFELEHEVHRTFYFDLGDGWRIIDNTIY